MIEAIRFSRIKSEIQGKAIFRVKATARVEIKANHAGQPMFLENTFSVAAIGAVEAMQIALIQVEAWLAQARNELLPQELIGVTLATASGETEKACTCDGGAEWVSTPHGKAKLSNPIPHASWCKARKAN